MWGFVFAVPSFYWAMGGMSGASSTISPSLVKLAQERDAGFVAVLWVTGALKVVGGLLGVALVHSRGWGRGMDRLLQLMAWGAGVLLVWHGVLFIGPAATSIGDAIGQTIVHHDLDRDAWIAGAIANGIPAAIGAVLRQLTGW